MVQASYARNPEYSYSPEASPASRVGKVRRTYRKINPKRIGIFKCSIFAFLYALLIVYLAMASSTLGYDIVSLEKNIEALEISNHRLEYSIAQQTSLERVEKIASTQLGMKPVNKELAVTLPDSGEQTVKLAGRPSESKQARSDERTLQKLYTNLKQLAANYD